LRVGTSLDQVVVAVAVQQKIAAMAKAPTQCVIKRVRYAGGDVQHDGVGRGGVVQLEGIPSTDSQDRASSKAGRANERGLRHVAWWNDEPHSVAGQRLWS